MELATSMKERSDGELRPWLSWLLLTVFVSILLILSGCGGGSADDGSNGEVLIGLTDAKGDFATYTVDVVSLTLTKQNGQTVETLPVNTRVDFAQYTDLTEFLTAATVPNGIYVEGKMVLDYSNADIQVEDADGNAVVVSRILDENGDPLTELQASVRLDGRNRLPIAPGIPASLTLDFDLKRSNSVAFDDADIPTVTVSPILVAEVNAKSPKRHRVRGPLKSVDVDNNRFALFIHPFSHRLGNGARHFGSLNVHINDDTVFDINGEGSKGNEGLAELALQPDKTAIIVHGIIHFAPRRFVATMVYAGSRVPGGTLDVVQGSVMSRSGDVLMVRGATLTRADGDVEFQDTVEVRLDASTIVRKQLSTDTYSINDISVGQRLAVFGTLSTDGQGMHIMDAVNGYAYMSTSVVKGNVVNVVYIPEQPPQYPFVLDVLTINGRNVSLYDFSGTGTDTANDAMADFYEVNTGALDTSAIVAGTAVAVGGFVTPFGSAPADFSAHTIVSPVHAIGLVPPVEEPETAIETPAP